MKDLTYLFIVFFAMTAVSAAERFLPFAAASWLSKQRWVKVVGSSFRLPSWCFLWSTLPLNPPWPEAGFRFLKPQRSS